MPVIKTYAAKAKAGKLLGGKQDTFSAEGLGIKYQNVLESELKAIGFGVDPSNKTGRFISDYNDWFFRVVQLKRITDFARGAAYDAGIFRAYDIAKRVGKGKKISRSLQNEINALGLKKDELLKISKFKNAREAYDNVETKQFLHKAGFNSSERDAIIPTVGNRLLFAQSNNPLVRSLGQFLSWAQAKTTQTNALISRIEDGDAALALRMLAAISIYGGVREMQIAFSPSEYYKDESNVPERWSAKYALEAMKLSGNVMPFQAEKLLSLISGPGSSEGLGGAIPSLALTNDLIKLVPNVTSNLYQGDFEGALSDTMDVAPFGKDIKHLLSGDFPIQPIEIYDIKDKPKSSGKRKRKRRQYAEGLEVEVPNAKEKPEERINPFTGEPYTALYYNGGAVRKQYNDGGSEGKKEGNIVKRALDEIENNLTRDIKENPNYYEKKRNILNRNPLNIVKSKTKWNNKLSDENNTDSTFEQFPTLFDGTRAGVLNVHSKYIKPQDALGGRRAVSISDMVDVLSPAKGDLKEFEHMDEENPNNPNFKNYIANRMGVGVNDKLNFEDPTIMKNFVIAKTGFEGDNYKLDDTLTSYAVQDAFNYRQKTGRYGQFNGINLTN
tara:strand:- start:188 stop:2020 length:1833 start_codon:yes stop_codon:yes gene_type:complete